MLSTVPGDAARIRVLVADDHPDSRLLIHTFLSLLGFSVETACDGSEALTAAARFHPDIVFLDVWMPAMDGVEACIRMRGGPCPPPVPIFGVTADVARLDKLPGCFDRVLAKPVDLDVVAALVRRRQAQLTGASLH